MGNSSSTFFYSMVFCLATVCIDLLIYDIATTVCRYRYLITGLNIN